MTNRHILSTVCPLHGTDGEYGSQDQIKRQLFLHNRERQLMANSGRSGSLRKRTLSSLPDGQESPVQRESLRRGSKTLEITSYFYPTIG